jgi:hypothetical protein
MDAEQCRRWARRYLIRACQMISPVNRATMIDMAVIWMGVAERANPRISGHSAELFKYEPFQPEHISVMGQVFEDVAHDWRRQPAGPAGREGSKEGDRTRTNWRLRPSPFEGTNA